MVKNEIKSGEGIKMLDATIRRLLGCMRVHRERQGEEMDDLHTTSTLQTRSQ